MALDLKDAVKQQTISLGTDDFLLSAKLAGWRAFDDVYVGGECFVYEAHAVNSAGSRTGDFEVGIGQFLVVAGGFKIARVSVLDSSNGGSKTVFSAGKKHVSVSFGAAQAACVPVRTASIPTIFVRDDGNDNQSGFEDTATGAKRTVTAAVSLISGLFRKARVVVSGAGAFGVLDTSDILTPGTSIELIAQPGVGRIDLESITCRHGCAVVLAGAVDRFNISRLRSFDSGSVFEGYGFCLRCNGEADTSSHIFAGAGGKIYIGDYVVAGNASDSGAGHVVADPFAEIYIYGSVTLAGSIQVETAFIAAYMGLSVISINGTIQLGNYDVVGRSAYLRGNAVLELIGFEGGVLSLPGSESPVVNTGAQVLS